MSQITTFLQPNGPGSGTVTSVSGGVGINITGNPSINPTVNLNVPVVIANGGTNATSFANTNGVVYFDGTRLVDTTVGTAGQILTSNGVGVAPTFQSNGATGASIFDTDSGVANAAANTITIHGAHGLNTSGAAATVTVAINNTITLGDLASIIGSPAITLTTGDITISAGNINLPTTNSAATEGVVFQSGTRLLHTFGSDNLFLGNLAGNFTLSTAQDNIGIGEETLDDLTTGFANTGVGVRVMDHVTTSNKNCAFGFEALNQLEQIGGGPYTQNCAFGYQAGFNSEVGNNNSFFGYGAGSNYVTGSNNIALGNLAGQLYTSSESSNITIGHLGVAAESHAIRIGTQGAGAGQQNTCYIQGIVGVTVSNPATVVINTATGQLGVAAGGGSPIETITGDTGGPLGPTAGNFNIFGAHGINVSGAVSTETVAINNAITLGDLSSIIGSPALTATTGDVTLSAGNVNLPNSVAAANRGIITFGGIRYISNFNTTGGTENVYVGYDAGNPAGGGDANSGFGAATLISITTADQNTIIGDSSGIAITSSSGNTVLGAGSLTQLATGLGGNIVIGLGASVNILTGEDNVCIGTSAGNNLTTNESSNILIGSEGIVGDNNTIRIGSQGAGVDDQNACYIAGIVGVTTSNSQMVTINSATGQLGAASIASLPLPYTGINHASSPYTVLTTDEYISADVTGGVITVLLPNAPVTGKVFIVKDKVGMAAASNITVTTVGGVVTIDGATSFIMNTAYQAAQFIFNGSAYEVF